MDGSYELSIHEEVFTVEILQIYEENIDSG
jgi:hypothetical protein